MILSNWGMGKGVRVSNNDHDENDDDNAIHIATLLQTTRTRKETGTHTKQKVRQRHLNFSTAATNGLRTSKSYEDFKTYASTGVMIPPYGLKRTLAGIYVLANTPRP